VNASKNAALLAIEILAQIDPVLHSALVDYRAGLAKEVEAKHERVMKALHS